MSETNQACVSACGLRPSRRQLLQCGLVGGLGLLHPWPADQRSRPESDARSAVLIVNVGGPSQLDTWDPKPDAPADIRGPLRAIRTSVPGIWVSELFPCQARIAHLQAFVRACHHTAPAVHPVGWQLAQTGCGYPAANNAPHIGQVVSQACGWRNGLPAHVRVSRALPTGLARPPLAALDEPEQEGRQRALQIAAAMAAREPARWRERYGSSRFGHECLLARCLVEAGVRVVTLHTFDDYREPGSWDVHGGPDFGNVERMRQGSAAAFDQAYAALIEDLAQRSLLEQTLVCCVAEFGRTPRINPAGGRDHWPLCWTTTLAGGGVRGGQVIGASDAWGSEPAERPVTPGEIVGTIYRSLGLWPQRSDACDRPTLATSATLRPIEELF